MWDCVLFGAVSFDGELRREPFWCAFWWFEDVVDDLCFILLFCDCCWNRISVMRVVVYSFVNDLKLKTIKSLIDFDGSILSVWIDVTTNELKNKI